MEEIILPQPIKDKLVQTAARQVAATLSKSLNKEISIEEVAQEMYCLKNGIITDNIPLAVLVQKELEESGISILYQERAEVPQRPRFFVNNPSGRSLSRNF